MSYVHSTLSSKSIREQFSEAKALLDQVRQLIDSGSQSEVAKASSILKSILPLYKDITANEESKIPEYLEQLKEIKVRLTEETNRVIQKRDEAKKAALTSSSSADDRQQQQAQAQQQQQQNSPFVKSELPQRPPLLQGYLKKLGEKGLVKSYKKRWFLQKDNKLYYYEKEGDTTSFGFINLPDMIGVKTIDSGFELVTPGRVYNFQVLKAADLNYWTEGLKEFKKYYTALQNSLKQANSSSMSDLPSNQMSLGDLRRLSTIDNSSGSGSTSTSGGSQRDYRKMSMVDGNTNTTTTSGNSNNNNSNNGTNYGSYSNGGGSMEAMMKKREEEEKEAEAKRQKEREEERQRKIKEEEEEQQRKKREQEEELKKQQLNDERLKREEQKIVEEMKKFDEDRERQQQQDKVKDEEDQRQKKLIEEMNEKQRERERQQQQQQQQQDNNNNNNDNDQNDYQNDRKSISLNSTPIVSSPAVVDSPVATPTSSTPGVVGNNEYSSPYLKSSSYPNTPAGYSQVDETALRKKIEEEVTKRLMSQQDELLEIERQRRLSLESEIQKLKEIIAKQAQSEKSNANIKLELQYRDEEIDRLKKDLSIANDNITTLQKDNETLAAKPKESFPHEYEWAAEISNRDREILSLREQIGEISANLKLKENAVSVIKRENEMLREETEKKDKYINSLNERNRDSATIKSGASGGGAAGNKGTIDINKLKESVLAHQSQNSFLISEIQRLETDMELLKEIKAEETEELTRSLNECIYQYRTLREKLLGTNETEYCKKIEKENLLIKKEYFLTLAVSVKLHRGMAGESTNINIHNLYDESIRANIDYKQWPEWISSVIEDKKNNVKLNSTYESNRRSRSSK
ncbi:pleckstrin domain-containing protein [Heterostelium album PN500]|uniref:Pleckstrin domain-containing protein n=1 Tax=Heterostelium pallidum (strain ATCC 26659 / Pp 5 / PN500) TaxID=670386 RepID=D3BAB1_HETP5|nr:pleckstrin domain-containing protein [Heterostelium album PN500]EFA81498.1 pleckstrin domain-containing protein [Heterostelium album PN500]|eukprot:XP_020433615.1 pleckstrin domain-containing protein [Heterostelium album PN500]